MFQKVASYRLVSKCGSFFIAAILVGALSSMSGCGGAAEGPTSLPTSCLGLNCALLYTRLDTSCPQVSGKNNRTYGAASQSNLTVNFSYRVEQTDGMGNLTVTQYQIALQGSQEVPLACDYDFKNGTQYQYDIVKECATTRAGATLANCTAAETATNLASALTTRSLAMRSKTAIFHDPVALLSSPSACVDVCKVPNSSACLKVSFTQKQTVDLDKATSILFGLSSTQDIPGCRQTVAVKGPMTKTEKDDLNRTVTVTGAAKSCIVDIESPLGKIQLFVPTGSGLKAHGSPSQFAVTPQSDEDTQVIGLPIDQWQKQYGGKILATEGAQAYTVLTTENGCIRLERYH
jgi:hypothetical protein